MNEDPHSLPDAPHAGPPVRRVRDGAGEAPLRVQAFSAAQMAVHGRQLAAHHTLSRQQGVHGLLARLRDNAAILAHAGAVLTRAAKTGDSLEPAAASLLEHVHLVDEHIRAAQHALLQPDCRALPCLVAPFAGAGRPRVYQLALEIVTHGDGRVDYDSLARFVAAYQEGAPLTLGELDALPVMLRVALVENLRRIAVRLERGRGQRKLARGWAERMLATAETRPGDLVLLVADMARAVQPLDAAFVAELARRLAEGGGALGQVLEWVGARLADEGLSVEQQVLLDSEEQAADGVSAANSVAGLGLVAALDWTAFVEAMGPAEQLLRQDPAGVYERMDGASRAHYRAALAELARSTRHDETQVAAEALALAGQQRAPAEGGLDARRRHIGYYLVGPGVAALRTRLGGERPVHWRVLDALGGLARRRPLAVHLGAAGTLALLATAALLLHAYRDGAGLAMLLVLGLFAACGASELALALAHALAARLTAPRLLPRMDFEAGIPDEARTLVVLPARLHDSIDLATLAASLETHYLRERDPNLRFCLLADFADAPQETLPEDAALLEAARAAIAALNARHGGDAGASAPFLLLQRPRVWNGNEGAWTGRARRHGQLADLGALLRGGVRAGFLLVEGDDAGLAAMRHVLVLEAGTEPAHGSLRQLVAAQAHPLNQPLLDAAGRRVIEGYGLLQPRLVPALPGEAATRYERRSARLQDEGVQLAHDLLGSAPFCGQGIYEADCFARLLAEDVPEEAQLADALLAGATLRCAQLAEATFVVPPPARYSDAVARRHRTLRGAWQLAACLRRLTAWPPLPPAVRWTLFDRLRASLVAPCVLALLVLCWALLPEPAFWSAAALSVFFLPAFLVLLANLADKPGDMLWQQHRDNWWRDARTALGQAGMRTALLPHEAWTGIDALARAAWRLLCTRRKLSEECTPAFARSSADMEANWRGMWFGPVLAVGSAVLLTFMHPFALFASAPLLLLWFLSPVLAWWLSQPRHAPQRASGLMPEQAEFLARLARRTWGFFETAVGTSTNWLPPAAVQQHPRPLVVARTSPSDIGYGLLATLAAWDFGFLAHSALLARLRAAFDSMDLLARHRGHFYAGYDSGTLAPLLPARLATTESGSLAAHLLTLAAGLEAQADAPIAGTSTLDGLRATLALVEEAAQENGKSLPRALRQALDACHAQLAPERCRGTGTLPGLTDCLQGAADTAAALLAALPQEADAALRDWAGRLHADCAAALDDLFALAPWMRAVQEYVLDASLTRIPTLRELAASRREGDALAQMVEEGVRAARTRLDDIADLAARARGFADMDFSLLYRLESGLLARGYDVAGECLEDASCAWLASEARLASFVAIATGQLPAAHWFALRRPLCIVDSAPLLQSEGGALSDYLAPLLVMPAWGDTLLDSTCRAVVQAQIDYARRHDAPWGMSTSGCNRVDGEMRYETRGFGVPGTGVRRGLADDLVIAPYAGMLALMVAPQAACANLERLAALGCIGEYGFYDALELTGARLPPGRTQAVVRTWQARHQGMALLALSSLLHGRPMARRFAGDPRVRAALPLLQERPPRAGAFEPPPFELDAAQIAPPQTPLPTRVVRRPGMLQPQVQLLSNGRYHAMVTSDGGGYSLRDGLALTRWRGDAAGVDGGLFCYLRDLESGALWSSGWQPTLAEPERYEVVFSEGSVQLRRRDHGIALTLDIAVSPEDDVELRRMGIRNLTQRTRSIELTSYVEVELACADAEILAERHALLCTRSADDNADDEDNGGQAPWLLHRMHVRAGGAGASFETSRARFAGRGSVLPAALRLPGALGGRAGPVADPVLAIRRVLTLAPGEEAGVDLLLGAAAGREEALALLDKYARDEHAGRVSELAWIRGQALLRHLNAGEADSQLYASLAGSLLYPQRALRADPVLIEGSRCDRSVLARHGLPGALPIVLTHVRAAAGLELLRQLLAAHAWWRLNGLAADLVVWYGDAEGYRQGLHQQIMALVATYLEAEAIDRPGGVHVRAFAPIPTDDRAALQGAARVVLFDGHGCLAEQLRRAVPAAAAALAPVPREEAAITPPATPALQFDDGIGGFSPDGREYLVRGLPGPLAPAPWTNVLANPGFGSALADNGAAHTWSGDAAHRLTASTADSLPGQGGEAFYVRDEDSGVFWSPAPLPAPSGSAYLTRHGFGYSVFEHAAHGVHSELTTFVALDASVKYTLLRLRNDSGVVRRLTVTGYAEWVLGGTRAEAAPHVVSARAPASGALLARSAWHPEFAGRAAFLHVDAGSTAFTCDRMDFLGRARGLARPLALERGSLGGSAGAGFDPCAALQVALDLQPGEHKELVFMLGVGEEDGIDAFIERHQGALAAGVAFDKVQAYWRETLGALHVETPDPGFDLLANGWLMYRTIGGLWAGDAADPDAGLQEAMAAMHADPRLLRAQLLGCAAAAHDSPWLALATCRYLRTTGDFAVLAERPPRFDAAAPGAPDGSTGEDDLYARCVHALRHALRVGPHGLPLADGGADSNGETPGERVWLAFLLIQALEQFAKVAERRGDYGFVLTCRAAAQALLTQAEDHGWDGAWYRRGYLDDGTPLGADLAAQSWAVLSGAAEPARAARALAALEETLCMPGPYPEAAVADVQAPGCGNDGAAARVRIWAAMAFARLGQVRQAWALFDMLDPMRGKEARADSVAYATPAIGHAGPGCYTGSAGWMLRLIVESLLGLERVGDCLVLAPLLPPRWPGLRMHYRYRGTTYEIEVRAAAARALLVDGQPVEGNTVQLVDDGAPHRVELHVVRHEDAAAAANVEATQSRSMP